MFLMGFTFPSHDVYFSHQVLHIWRSYAWAWWILIERLKIECPCSTHWKSLLFIPMPLMLSSFPCMNAFRRQKVHSHTRLESPAAKNNSSRHAHIHSPEIQWIHHPLFDTLPFSKAKLIKVDIRVTIFYSVIPFMFYLFFGPWLLNPNSNLWHTQKIPAPWDFEYFCNWVSSSSILGFCKWTPLVFPVALAACCSC